MDTNLVRQPAAGRRQLAHQRRAGPELAGHRPDGEVRGVRPGVRRTQGGEGVHPGVAARALHVVARDQAAEAVAHNVYPFVAGLRADPLDGAAQRAGRAGEVVPEDRVLMAQDPAEGAGAAAAGAP
jgi:hypothetical protein